MADQQPDPNYQPYETSTAITIEAYDTIHQEKEQFEQLLLQASGEFLYQHYNRILRSIDVSLERAAQAKVKLEQRQRRQKAKEHHDELQTTREQARLQRLQDRIQRGA